MLFRAPPRPRPCFPASLSGLGISIPLKCVFSFSFPGCRIWGGGSNGSLPFYPLSGSSSTSCRSLCLQGVLENRVDLPCLALGFPPLNKRRLRRSFSTIPFLCLVSADVAEESVGPRANLSKGASVGVSTLTFDPS